MTKRVLVTAGLPYSNGRLHVGHIAGCYLPADIYVRYLKMKGTEVRYVCGSDDHGVAIMLAAQKENQSPAEVASFYHQKQLEDFRGLQIEFDAYGSTSQTSFHRKASQDFFLKIHEKGFFKKKKSRQFFDNEKEMFLPDRFVTGTCSYCQSPNQNGDQCENCGKILDVDHLLDAQSTLSKKPASVQETTHWFLDLSQFEDPVKAWLKNAEIREHTRNYVQSLIQTGLVERSMTRDIDWGIPLPLDDPDAKGKVLYVWFDAPIGYVSNTMQMCEKETGKPEDYEKWWKSSDAEIVHFIGEDNTIFHCVIWIAMLSAEGSFCLPKGVVVNQFLNIQFPKKEVEKISKSRGTAVWIHEYLSEGNDPDILRYYLTSIAPEKARTVYSPEDLVQKNNTDLANVLGNFVNRILSFHLKHMGNQVLPVPLSKLTELDQTFQKRIERAYEMVTEELEKRSTKNALHALMDFCRDCNKYVDDKKPWATRKTDQEATALTLTLSLHAIYTISGLLFPFLPTTAQKIADIFEMDLKTLSWEKVISFPKEGQALRQPEILFQKIEPLK